MHDNIHSHVLDRFDDTLQTCRKALHSSSACHERTRHAAICHTRIHTKGDGRPISSIHDDAIKQALSIEYGAGICRVHIKCARNPRKFNKKLVRACALQTGNMNIIYSCYIHMCGLFSDVVMEVPPW